MQIHPRQLLWLIPVFAFLFLSGMALGYLTDQRRVTAQQDLEEWDGEKQAALDRAYLSRVLEQIRADQERPFEVEVSGGVLKGRFLGGSFSLEGTVSGRHFVLKRDADGFHIVVDGERKDPLSAPYALFTPYEHVELIESHLHQLSPQPVTDPRQPTLRGYQLTLPPQAVKAMLAGWLGPSFPTEDVFDRTFDEVSIGYQVWINPASEQLDQLAVDLRLHRGQNSRRDQLVFRLGEPDRIAEIEQNRRP